ncbi:MAG: hypothetical protein J7M38_05170, partial [Armatimonadetes bacterium]|nr:hypothetical protein [Armatimonadota bacterium]
MSRQGIIYTVVCVWFIFALTAVAAQAQNSPPTQPTVDVTPDNPVTGDDLTVSASGSTDADGDPVAYSYEWYKCSNGGPFYHQVAYDQHTVVPASATSKGEVWMCVVTPNDGTDDGPTGQDQVTIGNTAPSVDSVAISPDPADTTDDLLATPSGWDDADGDAESYTWQWEVDSGAGFAVIAGATTNTLDHTNFNRGDQVR